MDVLDQNDDGTVGAGFNRRSLKVLISCMAFCTVFMVAVLAGDLWLLLRDAHDWLSQGIGLVGLPLPLFVAWLGANYTWHWARCLRRGTPAFIFCRAGVVDNWNVFWPNLLPWERIARVYPAPLPPPTRLVLIPPAWYARRRGVVFILKDRRVGRPPLPRLRAFVFFLSFRWGYFVVGDRSLDVTADEFMRRLNTYYRRNVLAQDAA